MKYITICKKFSALLAVSALLVTASCNKEPEQFKEAATPTPTGNALGQTIASNPDESLYLALVRRGGLEDLINNTSATYTMFVPGNGAMRNFVAAVSGGTLPVGTPDDIVSGFLSTTFPADQAAAIVSYNIVPQAVKAADIPATYPNLQYPSILNPAPTISDLLRLTTFPSTANGPWINNVPITNVDILASNGVIHNTAALVTPPQRFLWDRISSDPDMTYLKAAILRADSGIVPAPANAVPTTLQGALESIGANLTVFVPTNAAFQQAITGAVYQVLLPLYTQQLTAYYISLGMDPTTAAQQAALDAPAYALADAGTIAGTPDVFTNPALYPYLTAQTVQGLVSYHITSARAFTNNFPTDPTAVLTLLNQGLPTHPGVTIKAGFGVPFATSATVKGLYNSTASNIIINAAPLTPDPYGTSDQHFVNGVIHKIDQVLLPLPL